MTETRAASATGLRFSKMHGAGNDFVIVDLRTDPALESRLLADDAALCRALADRHTGVGCDQLLTIEAPRSADALAAYRIWNADGSQAGQCGNGARCVAAWLVRDRNARGESTDARFALDSPAGRHAVDAQGEGRFRIAMGVPQFDPARIPLLGFDTVDDGYVTEFGGRALRFGAVSMGNPHALIEVADVDTAPVAVLGAYLQQHRMFPDSVNVGFAQVLAPDRIRLRVFERGAGETLACGSGACAAAAVLMRRGLVQREVAVELPGGTLDIAWADDSAPVLMSGPTAFVFEGVWP